MSLPTDTIQAVDMNDQPGKTSRLATPMFGVPFDNIACAPDSRYWLSSEDSSMEYQDLDTQGDAADAHGETDFDFDVAGNYNSELAFDNTLADLAAAETYGQLEDQASQSSAARQQSFDYDNPLVSDGDSPDYRRSGSDRGSKRRADVEVSELESLATSPVEPSSSHKSSKIKSGREKNRIAAHKCRQKAKLSLADLQQRERELSSRNKILVGHAGCLREEILGLKNEILRHSACDSEVIHNYIAKAAREV
ncbi:hypothetical protein F5X99DRAFT_412164 [Biscogniauxia marginata]|nr:hypothetical protein F5X99DRAFT_412164 [Biscogniauxia marginata]